MRMDKFLLINLIGQMPYGIESSDHVNGYYDMNGSRTIAAFA
jgi:hypothetical protein